MSETQKRTELYELGEFKLIDRLTEPFAPKHQETLKGVGDDAAVISCGKGECLVVTTDLLLEGIHFDLTYTPLKHLGYKAIVVNLSDVYAMNATPKQVTVSIGVSKRFCVEDLDELYSGIKLACDSYNVDLVGGDTSSSMTGMTISVTAIGSAKEDEIVYRSGAKVNDLICVTGNLGGAYMGLQLLEREKRIFLSNKAAKPKLEGYDYILERFLKPEARRNIIENLRKAGVKPTSMIDVSDGLSSELLHICKNSNVGCRIYMDKIPIDEQTARMAEEFNIDMFTAALNGGEDYELLFTVPLSEYQVVDSMENVRVIGYIVEPHLGAYMIPPSGEDIRITAQGWNALQKE